MKIAFKESNILTIGGRTLTPVETPVPPTGYKRFMWSFDGNPGKSQNRYQFQMSEISVNGLLGLNLVTADPYRGFGQTQMPEALLDGNTNTVWGMNLDRAEQSCYIIFDSSEYIVPESYSVCIGQDTSMYPNRNPMHLKFWCSSGTPTTYDDPSWILLHETDATLPDIDGYWVTFPFD